MLNADETTNKTKVTLSQISISWKVTQGRDWLSQLAGILGHPNVTDLLQY